GGGARRVGRGAGLLASGGRRASPTTASSHRDRDGEGGTMHTRTWGYLIRLVALAAAAGAGLNGCGGGDEDWTDSGPADAAARAATGDR
ncbi:MAG: hypothetical protein CO182_07100, partial [Lysobacterales bacterium CG_4_9_14_3_um_filter_62_6]